MRNFLKNVNTRLTESFAALRGSMKPPTRKMATAVNGDDVHNTEITTALGQEIEAEIFHELLDIAQNVPTTFYYDASKRKFIGDEYTTLSSLIQRCSERYEEDCIAIISPSALAVLTSETDGMFIRVTHTQRSNLCLVGRNYRIRSGNPKMCDIPVSTTHA